MMHNILQHIVYKEFTFSAVAINGSFCHPHTMATAPRLVTALETLSREVSAWVDEVAALTSPAKIHWCDGTEAEYHELEQQLVESNELIRLNPTEYPDCYLYRSAPS